MRAALEQLEALAVDAAAGELTGALLPALEHTLVTVLATSVEPAIDIAEDLDEVWSCLVDLFCSADARAAQVRLHRFSQGFATRDTGMTSCFDVTGLSEGIVWGFVCSWRSRGCFACWSPQQSSTSGRTGKIQQWMLVCWRFCPHRPNAARTTGQCAHPLKGTPVWPALLYVTSKTFHLAALVNDVAKGVWLQPVLCCSGGEEHDGVALS